MDLENIEWTECAISYDAPQSIYDDYDAPFFKFEGAEYPLDECMRVIADGPFSQYEEFADTGIEAIYESPSETIAVKLGYSSDNEQVAFAAHI